MWLDYKNDASVIRLDFTRASNSVNHILLLYKLSQYKFHSNIINWIANLYNRSQSFHNP